MKPSRTFALWFVLTLLLAGAANAGCERSDWNHAKRLTDSLNDASRTYVRKFNQACSWQAKTASSAEFCRDFRDRRAQLSDVDDAGDYAISRAKKRENAWYSLHEDCGGSNSENAYDNYSRAFDHRKELARDHRRDMASCRAKIADKIEEFCG